jgi:hypothetical protein
MHRIKLAALAVLLVMIATCEANAQEADIVVQPGDSLTVLIVPGVSQDTLPPVQDTLPPITLPPVQDTLPPVQDTLPPVQDTVGACLAGSLCWPEDQPYCPEGWTCTAEPPLPPIVIDTIPPPGIPSSPQIEVTDDTIAVVTWEYPDDAELVEFYVRSGLDAGGEYKEAFVTQPRAGIVRKVPGEYFVCVEVRDLAGNWAPGARCNGYTIGDSVPPVPPDTVPVPPDTVPPEPGDSLQWHLGLLIIDEAGDTTLVRQGQQQPAPNFDVSIVEGVYDVWIAEVDPGIEPWDSVTVGHPSEERTCTVLPCGVYGDDPSTRFAFDSSGLGTSYLIAYEVWGDSASRPDKLNPWFIEGTLFTIDVKPVPPTPDGLALYSQPCQYPSGSDCTGFYLPADSTYRDGPHSISLYANGSEQIDVDYVTFFARDSNWDRAWTLNDPLPWATFEDSGASWRIPDGIRLNNYDNTRDDEDFWGDVTVGYIAGNIVGDETVVVARDSIVMRIR